jgi:hypothetical protein
MIKHKTKNKGKTKPRQKKQGEWLNTRQKKIGKTKPRQKKKQGE